MICSLFLGEHPLKNNFCWFNARLNGAEACTIFALTCLAGLVPSTRGCYLKKMKENVNTEMVVNKYIHLLEHVLTMVDPDSLQVYICFPPDGKDAVGVLLLDTLSLLTGFLPRRVLMHHCLPLFRRRGIVLTLSSVEL